MKPERPRRALLVASIGVATVSYVLAGCGKTTKEESAVVGNPADPIPVAGNLPAPIPIDAALPEPVAVVDSGAPVSDAGKTTADAGKPVTKPPVPTMPRKPPPTSGNLMAPR